jgi:hypothetical protein
MNTREKCSICGRRRVIVHEVNGGGHDDGDKYCRECEDDYQSRGGEDESDS